MKIKIALETKNEVRFDHVESGACFLRGDTLFMRTDESNEINLSTGVLSNDIKSEDKVILKPDAFVTV